MNDVYMINLATRTLGSTHWKDVVYRLDIVPTHRNPILKFFYEPE